ncbi:MAG: hypothetical protein J07HX5_02124 [halophilic archaeon J07HX5]|nr:MAG: hypothetical protein J07HX5_02124 [halophilic archaeon J07HX5]
MCKPMSGEKATVDDGDNGPNIGVVAGVAFTAITLLAAIAYTVMLNLVDWVAVGVLSYPVAGVAPFAVITGAILTIPIVVPTVLVTARFAD